MKLLIVEDEEKAAEYLRKGLTEEGYSVEVAHNGVDGLHMASVNNYDLLILDGQLPGIDGLAMLSAIRQSSDVPILMVTARSRVEDRVKGLQSGADDYLTKPYAFSELVARVQVLLRRRTGGRQVTEDLCTVWPIWRWIPSVARSAALVSGLTSPPRSLVSSRC